MKTLYTYLFQITARYNKHRILSRTLNIIFESEGDPDLAELQKGRAALLFRLLGAIPLMKVSRVASQAWGNSSEMQRPSLLKSIIPHFKQEYLLSTLLIPHIRELLEGFMLLYKGIYIHIRVYAYI